MASGWRFFYSPAKVLDGAEVAFIGLNPGGTLDEETRQHPEFTTEAGSAYETESWAGHPSGRSPLQIQVRCLFKKLGVKPSEVLAGNLVPFRSRNWQTLKDRSGALRFAKCLWRDVLRCAKPSIVVAMGSVTRAAVKDLLSIQQEDLRSIPINWEPCRAEYGTFSNGGRFLGVPHLSRFPIMTRDRSADAVATLIACAKGGKG